MINKDLDGRYLENGDELINLSKEELISEIRFHREEISRLEAATIDLAKLYSYEEKERERAEKGLEILEESSMQMAAAFGEINEERKAAEEAKELLEKTSMDLLSIIGELGEEYRSSSEAISVWSSQV